MSTTGSPSIKTAAEAPMSSPLSRFLWNASFTPANSSCHIPSIFVIHFSFLRQNADLEFGPLPSHTKVVEIRSAECSETCAVSQLQGLPPSYRQRPSQPEAGIFLSIGTGDAVNVRSPAGEERSIEGHPHSVGQGVAQVTLERSEWVLLLP